MGRGMRLARIATTAMESLMKIDANKTTATGTTGPATKTQHDKLLEQSRKWVAQTFFGTLLKQMRESPFRSGLFDGGRGGQVFGQLYDDKMVDHFAKCSGGKLVKSLVKHLENRSSKTATAEAGGSHVSTLA